MIQKLKTALDKEYTMINFKKECNGEIDSELYMAADGWTIAGLITLTVIIFGIVLFH